MGLLLAGPPARAALTPEASLNVCQGAVKAAASAYVNGYLGAASACLQLVSTAIVQRNAANAGTAAAGCVAHFRRTYDTRGLGLSLRERLVTAVNRKCQAGMPGVTHTLADILGTGAGVAQPLNGENLNTWCRHYAGDGSIDSVAEWLSCIEASHTCSARAALVTQFPRAFEWLARARASMLGVTPPLSDPNRVTDAVAGLDAAAAAIDGPNADAQPDILCPPLPGICGNGTVEVAEQCDGANLGGQTCEGLGYNLGGTLTCTAGCRFNVSGCVTPLSPPTVTGQTTCYDSSGAMIWCAGTGQDGDLRKGIGRSYADNGDGTITDNTTGLVWEKKSYDGSIHDWTMRYSWDDAFAVFIAGLNSANFAGHNDWRLPNIRELLTLTDYSRQEPALDPVFYNGCTEGCTVTTCSCRSSYGSYWASTSHAWDWDLAWVFYDSDGSAGPVPKVRFRVDNGLPDSNYFMCVRAVRGGVSVP
jgi:hypothetical protein